MVSSLENVNQEEYNPCISCGACCAYFRASFYWAETDACDTGAVPADMTEKMNDFRCVMKGTNQPNPRCVALIGDIGKSVRCSIYEFRASVCRDFKLSYENGIYNPDCDRARAAHNLPPLPPRILPPVKPDEIDPDHNNSPNKRPTNPPMAA